MHKIDDFPSLIKLKKALEHNESLDARGHEWYIESALRRRIRDVWNWIFPEFLRLENGDFDLSVSFCSSLDKLERENHWKFNENQNRFLNDEYIKVWITNAKLIADRLSVVKSKEAGIKRLQLLSKLHSLESRCRINQDDPSLPSNTELYEKVEKIAGEWKKERSYLKEKDHLTKKNKEALSKLCRLYPEYARLLIDEKEMCDKFKHDGETLVASPLFTWVLTHKLAVEFFVEFNGVSHWLKSNNCLTRADRETLGVELRANGDVGIREKRPWKMMDGKRVNIANRDELVQFSNPINKEHSITLKVKDVIVGCYKYKESRVGNFEWVPKKGDILWHGRKFGARSRGDLNCDLVLVDEPNWIENIPATLDLSLEKAKKRYPSLKDSLKEGQNILTARSFSDTPFTELEREVGTDQVFLEYAQYLADDGLWHVREFTFRAKRNGASSGFFGFIPSGNTVKGSFMTGECRHLERREMASYAMLLDKEKDQKFLEVLAQKITESRKGEPLISALC